MSSNFVDYEALIEKVESCIAQDVIDFIIKYDIKEDVDQVSSGGVTADEVAVKFNLYKPTLRKQLYRAEKQGLLLRHRTKTTSLWWPVGLVDKIKALHKEKQTIPDGRDDDLQVINYLIPDSYSNTLSPESSNDLLEQCKNALPEDKQHLVVYTTLAPGNVVSLETDEVDTMPVNPENNLTEYQEIQRETEDKIDKKVSKKLKKIKKLKKLKNKKSKKDKKKDSDKKSKKIIIKIKKSKNK